MAVARPYGFEIDFVWNPISGSAAWFFFIIFKFIFTPIFGTKIHEQNPWHQKKNFIFEARFLYYTDSVDSMWPRQRGR